MPRQEHKGKGNNGPERNLLVTADHKLNVSQKHAVAKKTAATVSHTLSKLSMLLSTAFPPLEYGTYFRHCTSAEQQHSENEH